MMSVSRETPARVRLGHIRLKVIDLDRAVEFLTRFLHMKQVERAGDEYAFLSGGDAHHEVALMRVSETPEGSLPSDAPGFDHVAFEVSGKREFAQAYVALTEAGMAVRPVDNGISWGMYFHDPEGNQMEIFCDTRREAGGRLLWEGRTVALTHEAIMAELGEG